STTPYGRRMRPIALLLASAAIIAYASNFLLHVEGDAAPNILTAASWVAQGNADLDEFVGRVPFDVQYVGGHAYPYTPPGVAALIRPVEAFVAALGILRARRGGYALRYVLWGFPAAAFLATYYVLAFGGPRQSYAGLTWSLPPPGWLGLLVSPSRGLFVYSPFLVFGVAGFAMAWRARDESARTVRDLS